jgi:hypothetical protein
MDTPVDSIARINVSYRMMYHYWCMIILGEWSRYANLYIITHGGHVFL